MDYCSFKECFSLSCRVMPAVALRIRVSLTFQSFLVTPGLLRSFVTMCCWLVAQRSLVYSSLIHGTQSINDSLLNECFNDWLLLKWKDSWCRGLCWQLPKRCLLLMVHELQLIKVYSFTIRVNQQCISQVPQRYSNVDKRVHRQVIMIFTSSRNSQVNQCSFCHRHSSP